MFTCPFFIGLYSNKIIIVKNKLVRYWIFRHGFHITGRLTRLVLFVVYRQIQSKFLRRHTA